MTTDSGDAGPIRTPDQRLRVFVSSTLQSSHRAGGGGQGDLGAPAHARHVRARRPTASASRALPRLSRAVRCVRWPLLAALWLDWAWDGHLGTRRRVPSVGRPAAFALREVACSGAGTAVDGDARRALSAGTDSYRSFKSTGELGRLVRDDLALLLSERFSTRRLRAVPSAAPAATETRRRVLAADTIDIVGWPRGQRRRPVRIARLTRRAVGDADGARRHRQDPTGDRSRGGAHGSGAHHDVGPPASIMNPTLVLTRVAAAVNAPIEGTRTALDTLIERFAQNPTVLILDNLEQVTGAAAELEQLLAACPEVRSLPRAVPCCGSALSATIPSRHSSCPHSPSGHRSPSSRRFRRCASSWTGRGPSHDFKLDDTNAAAVAEICRRLDGLPSPSSSPPLARECCHPRHCWIDSRASSTRWAQDPDLPSGNALCERPSNGASDSSTIGARARGGVVSVRRRVDPRGRDTCGRPHRGRHVGPPRLACGPQSRQRRR